VNAQGLSVLRHEDLVSLVRGRVTGAAARPARSHGTGTDESPTACAGPCRPQAA